MDYFEILHGLQLVQFWNISREITTIYYNQRQKWQLRRYLTDVKCMATLRYDSEVNSMITPTVS